MQYSVSVIIPCKNEQGTIEAAVRRIPDMGRGTELVFCDDRSTDGTAEEITRNIARYPTKNIRLVDGPGICKSRNVWTGIAAATGDIVMILDADLTVMPEELPLFYHALTRGESDFINGSRMLYPMEQGAMKWLNKVGNRFFSTIVSTIIGRRISDTLCGTKAFWRKDWHRLKGLIGSFGVEDQGGDYDLLFSAALNRLAISEVPVHYVKRTYGETKMRKPVSTSLMLLRMCAVAFSKLRRMRQG
jgi:glycosyltransferase involved in cell wall biosynthesis